MMSLLVTVRTCIEKGRKLPLLEQLEPCHGSRGPDDFIRSTSTAGSSCGPIQLPAFGRRMQVGVVDLKHYCRVGDLES